MSLYENLADEHVNNKIITFPFIPSNNNYYHYHSSQPFNNLQLNDSLLLKQILCLENFSLLEKLSKKAIIYLDGILKYKKNNNYISYILKTYIKNVKIPYINNLIGALHFVEIKYNNKHFYLIGEYHTDDVFCNYKKGDILIPDLIEMIVKTTPKVIDVFLETEINIKDFNVKNFIRATYDRFKECNNGCKYKNLRLHRVDIRSKKYDKALIDVLYRYSKGIIKNKSVSHLLKIIKENKSEVIKLLNNENLMKKEINTAINFSDKISKQLDNIKDKFIVDKLKQFIQNLKNSIKYKKISYTNFISKNRNIHKYMKMFLSSYRVSYMDFYCLARIFRSFRKIKNKASSDPENIIIHAGDRHIINYKSFLTKIGGKVIYEVNNYNNDYNCINIKDVNQPFFK